MSISEWHYVDGGTSVGPLPQAEMEALIAQGRVTANTLVWNDTMPQWEPAAIHFSGFQSTNGPARGGPTRGYLPPGVDPAVIGRDGLYVGAPSRDFGEAVKVCFSKFVTFSGRASRSEFWYFVLFSFIAGFVLGFIDEIVRMSSGTSLFLSDILSLVLFLPSLAVSVRRMHDIDRTGWWVGAPYLFIIAVTIYASLVASTTASIDVFGEAFVMLMLAAVVGMLAYLILMLVFYCTRGTLGPNRYG